MTELFGAALFISLLLFPKAGEAHMGWQRLGGEHFAPPKGCVASPMGRAISAPSPCQAAPAKPGEPDRRLDRKLAATLLATLYCRTHSTEVSEITRKAAALLLAWSSLQRILHAGFNDPVERPQRRFETPLDLGMAGMLTLAPPPDG